MSIRTLPATVTQRNDREQAIRSTVQSISAEPWFVSNQNNVRWLTFYTTKLYQHGLVLRHLLAQCATAAAKHRFAVKDDAWSHVGAFSAEDISVMRGIFHLANQNPELPPTSQEARALARQVVRLYRSGHHDPFIVLHLIGELPSCPRRVS